MKVKKGVGRDLNPETMVLMMVESENKWKMIERSVVGFLKERHNE